MYKWSPYYRRYRSKWSPYYSKYNTYRWSPVYNKFRWSPLYNRYRWSPRYYRYLCDRYYNYRYSPYYRRYYFDDLYVDLKTKMDMFKTFLDSIPKNRSEIVNHLEIPEDVLKDRPYARDDDDDELSSIGSISSICTLDDFKARPRSPLSTDSSISLTKAMTSSEIDYDIVRKFKNRRLSDPFHDIDIAIQAFPEEFLVPLKKFPKASSEPDPVVVEPKRERPLYNEDLFRRMNRFFDEECQVFAPDDPGLLDLEEALESINLKALDLDLI